MNIYHTFMCSGDTVGQQELLSPWTYTELSDLLALGMLLRESSCQYFCDS